MPSPYEEAFGHSLESLHPRLRSYFGEIPRGSLGMGSGIFDVVGTPRRWLWPALWVLGAHGIMFATWQHDVPFTVVNRPVVDARGNIAVAAERTFRFDRGDRSMVDAITAERGGLVDHLGRSRRLISRFSGHVVDGALTLTSTVLAVRVGRVRVTVPSILAPVVTLVEHFDVADGRQHVALEVRAPLIGRLYEYSGSFTYRIEEAT
ncbi:MAG: DUF4166 domain-containing protein [Candidatus Saccharibacteria bacterium]|nr:DUF4166 domain-containing protein [Microbacteriaceae bacterium]